MEVPPILDFTTPHLLLPPFAPTTVTLELLLNHPKSSRFPPFLVRDCRDTTCVAEWLA
jgi:hypothetical protein